MISRMLTSVGADHLRILSRPEWVEPVVMFIKHRAAAMGITDADQLNRLVVAMTEAISNAIIHGNFGLPSSLKEEPAAFGKALAEKSADPAAVSRVVDIRVERCEDRCVWTVTDQGEGFDVKAMLQELEMDKPDADFVASGRGVAIMRAFVDEVAWGDGGRQIRLSINVGAASNQRRSVRKKYTAAVALQADGSSKPIECIARDLSQHGIGIVAPIPFEQGSTVTITLNLRHPSQRLVRGRVVRCRMLSGDYHDVAIEFTGAMLPTASN